MKTIMYVAFVYFGDIETCQRFVEGRELPGVQCVEVEASLAPETSPRPRARPSE